MKISYNILILGSEGQLGREFKKLCSAYSSCKFTFISRKELDLTNEQEIIDFFIKNNFDIVINCAAYTQVDKAEDEKELAKWINCYAVKVIAKVLEKKNTAFIHYSTDFVFDGERENPYKETDKPNPKNYYGKTKLLGEQEIFKVGLRGIILRTSWLYSNYGNNFLKTILELSKKKKQIKVIDDQKGSPTYARDLAEVTMKLIELNNQSQLFKKTQILNYCNKGEASWCEFAEEIVSQAKVDCQIKPIKSYNYISRTKRPMYSCLDTTKIEAILGLNIPTWKDSLGRFLSEEGKDLL